MDEIDWRQNYRRALANVFALGEVISRIRDEFDVSDERIDALINEATTKWHAMVDASESE